MDEQEQAGDPKGGGVHYPIEAIRPRLWLMIM